MTAQLMRGLGRVLLGSGALLGLVLGGDAMASSTGDPLGQYRWQNRIVLVVSNAAHRMELERQAALLRASRDGVLDRDLITVTVADDDVAVDGIETGLKAEHIRRTYTVPTDGFHVVLIGKDGGVKLRSEGPVDVEQLFALIDTMPMRRREDANSRESASTWRPAGEPAETFYDPPWTLPFFQRNEVAVPVTPSADAAGDRLPTHASR